MNWRYLTAKAIMIPVGWNMKMVWWATQVIAEEKRRIEVISQPTN